jgi:hypothetical protein
MKSMADFRAERIANGMCPRCLVRYSRKGIKYCQECLNKIKIYREKNKEKTNNTRLKRRVRKMIKGICPICESRIVKEGWKSCLICIEKSRIHSKSYREKFPEKVKKGITKWRKEHPEENRRIFKRHYSKLKDIIFNHYGKQCVCCGESFEFLTLDHINNNGAEHRRQLGRPRAGGDAFYRWVIKNNFPEDLQPLCWNCNCAKSIYGICPHEKKEAGRWENTSTIATKHTITNTGNILK